MRGKEERGKKKRGKSHNYYTFLQLAPQLEFFIGPQGHQVYDSISGNGVKKKP